MGRGASQDGPSFGSACHSGQLETNASGGAAAAGGGCCDNEHDWRQFGKQGLVLGALQSQTFNEDHAQVQVGYFLASCVAGNHRLHHGDDGGNFAAISLGHWQIALTTGVIAGLIGVGFSFGSLFMRYGRSISFALVTFIATLVADFFAHPSDYGSLGWGHGEAMMTAIGAAAISPLISFSPIAAAVERIEKPDHRALN